MIEKTTCTCLVVYKEPHELEEWIESLPVDDTHSVERTKYRVVTTSRNSWSFMNDSEVENRFTFLHLQSPNSICRIGGMQVHHVKWLTNEVTVEELNCIETRRRGNPVVTYEED